jgi:phasin
MNEARFQVPTELRYSVEKAIDQAEQAFDVFFETANKSMASVPSPTVDVSKKVLSLAEHNMKSAFDHARKLVHATDLQEAMQIQSDFLKHQFTNAGEQIKQIADGMMSAAKDASERKP